MRKSIIVIIIIVNVLLFSTSIIAQGNNSSDNPALTVGLESGYNGGPGVVVFGMISNLSSSLPMNFRFSLGYSGLNPGLAADARRIFINNATNGVPEKSGRQFDFRFDMMYPVHLMNLKKAFLIIGPRHSRFTGNFKFIGGNEDFDVTSHQWGIGTGFESYFPISKKMDLLFHMGLDYYFEATLSGHDTEYAPDGDNANPREDYTYDDADDAINQPKLEPRVMLGVAYRF